MVDYEIKCVIYDSQGSITRVGIDDYYDVQIIVGQLQVGNTAFTYKDGKKVRVYAKQNKDTDHWHDNR